LLTQVGDAARLGEQAGMFEPPTPYSSGIPDQHILAILKCKELNEDKKICHVIEKIQSHDRISGRF
jgi:hypothetical protein